MVLVGVKLIGFWCTEDFKSGHPLIFTEIMMQINVKNHKIVFRNVIKGI